MAHSSPHLYRQAGLSAGVDQAPIDQAVARIAYTEARGGQPILSLKHLAHLSGAPYLYLRDVVARAIDPYNDISLTKKSGGARPISAPEPVLMDVQRFILRFALRGIVQHPSSFAYQEGRSIVDCAWRHVGASWLIKLDLHNFFGRVSEKQVYRVFERRGYSALVALELARICTRVDLRYVNRLRETRYSAIPVYAVNGVGFLPQGGPTSGALANAVATPLDFILTDLANEHKMVYTRYSDDLIFSSAELFSRDRASTFIHQFGEEIAGQGFVLHKKKTHIVPPGARHVVLGLMVGQDSVRLIPEFRRRIEVHIRGVRGFGLQRHAHHRGFHSTLAFVDHINGSLAFALDVEPDWTRKMTDKWRHILSVQNFPFLKGTSGGNGVVG
jgi:RNA-directed DNA polymerase